MCGHAHLPTTPPTHTNSSAIFSSYFAVLLFSHFLHYIVLSSCFWKIVLKIIKYLASCCISVLKPLPPSLFFHLYKWDTAPAHLSSIFCQRSLKHSGEGPTGLSTREGSRATSSCVLPARTPVKLRAGNGHVVLRSSLRDGRRRSAVDDWILYLI